MPRVIYAQIKGIAREPAQDLLEEPPPRATFAHLLFRVQSRLTVVKSSREDTHSLGFFWFCA
jgi:hypothetical protein